MRHRRFIKGNWDLGMGTGASIVFLLLSVLYFPLAIIYIVVYALFKDNGISGENIFVTLELIGAVFVILAAPVITTISIIMAITGHTTISSPEATMVHLLTITEMGVVIYLLVKNKREPNSNDGNSKSRIDFSTFVGEFFIIMLFACAIIGLLYIPIKLAS